MKKIIVTLLFGLTFCNNGLNAQWASSIGGTSYDYCSNISVDILGNVYITGAFGGDSVDFDPGSGTAYLNSTGYNDIYFAKYNSDGVYQWAHNIGGVDGSWGNDITTDNSGNVYITGYFEGSNVDFDPDSGTAYLSGNGGYDIYFAKYDSNGAYHWAYGIGGGGFDQGNSIKVDVSSNVYITGFFYGSDLDFDPGVGTAYLSSSGGDDDDIFVAKYNTNGEYQWAYNIGGISGEVGSDIVLDDSGNVYLTGHFYGNDVDFDPGIDIANLSSNGGTDVFFAKYNSNGEYQWTHGIGGSSGDVGYGITVDNMNNVYLAGTFSGSNIDFDTGYGTLYLNSNGGTDIYFANYYSGNGTLPIDAEIKNSISEKFCLHSNYPNPFNLLTKIKFALPKAEKVKMEVYNLLGQEIETLINKLMPAGSHEVEFTAKNLPSGVYIYRIEAGEFQEEKKMILLR